MANIDVYAAGLVDGEGCIYVGCGTRTNGRPGTRAHWAVLDVGMTQKALPVLRMLHKEYGGQILESRKATEKWDAAWAWQIHGSGAAQTLRRLAPYLVLKAEQARLAIRVEDIRLSLVRGDHGRARWTEDAYDRCQVIVARIKELNRKGPPPPLEPPPFKGAKLVALLVGGQYVSPQGDLFADLGYTPFTGPWPTSGFTWGNAWWTLNSSECPSDAVESSLSDILEEPGPHLSRYFLSPRAAAGILRRARKRGRELPPHLMGALEALAQSPPSRGEGDAATG